MLEYVLFDKKPFQIFIDWLKEKAVAHEVAMEEGNYLIQVPEDLDDDLLEAVEEKYDECMDMNEELQTAEANEVGDAYAMSGILVTLKDGSVSHADVDPDLVNRMLSAISAEELNDFVSAIVDAVEKPQPDFFCQRQRDE